MKHILCVAPPLAGAAGFPIGILCASVRQHWQAAPAICRPQPVRCRAISEPRHFSLGQPRLSQTAGKHPSSPSASRNPLPQRKAEAPVQGRSASTSRILVLAVLAAAGAASYYAFGDETSGAAGKPLNQDTFVPFSVVAREAVSPTAFVLTLRLDTAAAGARAITSQSIARSWRHGLWSVEVRQPQLQIARDYTPLPRVGASAGNSADEDEDGTTIRLFVRVVPGGEMSRYLSQRTVGDTVDLRGPRLGFNVVKRLRGGAGTVPTTPMTAKGDDACPSQPRKLVFVAAGTGIAPALQAAKAALESTSTDTTTVAILWANRLRVDSAGLESAGASGSSEHNAIVRDLHGLQQRFGPERLHVRRFADEDLTFIKEADLKVSAGLSSPRWWKRWTSPEKKEAAAPAAPLQPSSTPSFYESNKILEGLEGDPDEEASQDGSANGLGGGKNLVIVSGPDGFVSLLAGRKQWSQGKERQGSIGGMVGSLQSQYPVFQRDWQVLKL